jgi:hypothetical protein
MLQIKTVTFNPLTIVPTALIGFPYDTNPVDFNKLIISNRQITSHRFRQLPPLPFLKEDGTFYPYEYEVHAHVNLYWRGCDSACTGYCNGRKPNDENFRHLAVRNKHNHDLVGRGFITRFDASGFVNEQEIRRKYASSLTDEWTTREAICRMVSSSVIALRDDDALFDGQTLSHQRVQQIVHGFNRRLQTVLAETRRQFRDSVLAEQSRELLRFVNHQTLWQQACRVSHRIL